MKEVCCKNDEIVIEEVRDWKFRFPVHDQKDDAYVDEKIIVYKHEFAGFLHYCKRVALFVEFKHFNSFVENNFDCDGAGNVFRLYLDITDLYFLASEAGEYFSSAILRRMIDVLRARRSHTWVMLSRVYD